MFDLWLESLAFAALILGICGFVGWAIAKFVEFLERRSRD